MPRTALIFGAGPAGLTAAYEFLDRTDVIPIVFEQSGDLGGLSKTVNYGGNRIDIGGHRFFSRSDRVMAWWTNILPLQGFPSSDDIQLGRQIPIPLGSVQRTLGSHEVHPVKAPDPEVCNNVMLFRQRLSRILYLRKFFDYPISLNLSTLSNLGLRRMTKIGLSYGRAYIQPIRPERSLEDFFINRFGRELYSTFFKDYTEKVWGVPCSEIRPEWGAQRIKGLSIARTLTHAARKLLGGDRSLAQKGTETSLIERFLYPKFGPGQMWETVAAMVMNRGGTVHLNHRVIGVESIGAQIVAARVQNTSTGEVSRHEGDYFVSSLPLRDLVEGMIGSVPHVALEISRGLVYRDFVTVGVLLRRIAIRNTTRHQAMEGLIPDNWIYIQESDLHMGRIQIFNNWSPYMVKDPGTVWLGIEYFCAEGDAFWNMEDSEIANLAVLELQKTGLAVADDVIDRVVIRMPKAYPAYFGTYDRMSELRVILDRYVNLFPIGRNGQHRYNNQDHSMLSAMAAVDLILQGSLLKQDLWSINAEQDYHEEK